MKMQASDSNFTWKKNLITQSRDSIFLGTEKWRETILDIIFAEKISLWWINNEWVNPFKTEAVII